MRAKLAAVMAVCLVAPAVAHAQIVDLFVEGEYFHVRLQPPADLALPVYDDWSKTDDLKAARRPRLVPHDGSVRAVYSSAPAALVAGRMVPLEFVGRLGADVGKQATFALHYPVDADNLPADRIDKLLARQSAWKEAKVEIDFTRAKPSKGRRLDKLWPSAQASALAALEAQSPDVGFFTFARLATARRHDINAPKLDGAPERHANFDVKQAYEITTGAGSIADAMSLQRMRKGARHVGPRTIDIAAVVRPRMTEHPWEKMIGDKKPTIEPLARLVPDDNYYVRFKSFAKFLEAGDLLDDWGSAALQAWETNARDNRMKQKLEQQLCLKSGPLSRLFGPAVIKSLAITGSDPYFREGTDVTVIFQVTNVDLFFKNADSHVKEARDKFKGELREAESAYKDCVVQSFVTPQREVSLHRTTFDDYVVCSNSKIGLQRVIDTWRKNRVSLADSLDFQYMRTAFPVDDPKDEVFVFLSDAFIRNLVSPRLRIKERRRLEALTSLQMATNGALFTGWDTGSLPKSHDEMLRGAALHQADLVAPEGSDIVWDPRKRLAISDAYNTMHFLTPLVELPIDRVSSAENDEYSKFRQEYEDLYRQFSDPVGIRLTLDAKKVRWETYVLPLSRVREYQFLRTITNGGTMKYDRSQAAPASAAYFSMHLGSFARAIVQGQFEGKGAAENWLGNSVSIQFRDAPTLGEWARQKITYDLGDRELPPARRRVLLNETPVMVSALLWNRNEFERLGLLTKNPFIRKNTEIEKIDYRGKTIVKAKEENEHVDELDHIHQLLLDDRWLISQRPDQLKEEIDRKLDDAKRPAGEVHDAMLAMRLQPQNKHTRPAVERVLEWELHRRALANTNLMLVLYRTGAVKADDSPAKVHDAAWQWFGYDPASPDRSPFRYDRAADEVTSVRHGSWRKPSVHDTLAPGSPIFRMLDQLDAIEASMRFREDGLHATVIIERK